MIKKLIVSLLLAGVIASSLMSMWDFSPDPPFSGNNCTTQAGSNSEWDTAANWTGCGGGVPGVDDTVITTKAMTIPPGVIITVGSSGPASPCKANSGACTRPTLANVAGSTALAAATYYVKYALVDTASGKISSPSPETQGLVLTSPGSQLPRVTFPSGLGVPTGTTASVYVGTAVNTETLYASGISAGTTIYDLSIAIPGSGAAVPAFGVTGIILGGSLTLGAGASLTIKGDLDQGNNTITFGNASTLIVDHSGQNESTKRPYVMWNQSASSQSSAKVVTNGTGVTSADWVFWKMNVGGASARWQSRPSTYVGGDRFLDGGLVQLAYLDMRGADGTGTCGDVNWPCISMAQSASTRTVSLDHVICNGCGEILHNYGYYSAGATISWKNITTTGSLGTYSIFGANYQTMTVAPVISGNSFDKLAYLPAINAVISDNYFAHTMAFYSSGATNETFKCSLTGNFVRQLINTDTDQTVCGDLTSNYYFMDDYTDAGALQSGNGKGNPHGPRHGTFSTWNVSGNLFTANGPNKSTSIQTGQGTSLFPNVGAITSVIDHNIVTQNPNGLDCNLTLATPSNHALVLNATFHHNTACTGTNGSVLRLGEDDLADGSANNFTFRDNLIYNATTYGGVPSTDTFSVLFAIRKDQPIGAYPGTVAAGGHKDIVTSTSNYNFSCGVRDPASQQNYKGYYFSRTSMFPPSAGALPANDIQNAYNTGPASGGCSAANGPQFVGATANGVDGMPSIITWAVTKGATGTNAQKVTYALNLLMTRSSRVSPSGVMITDLIDVIKAGHRPQNAQINGTSSIADDIGAMPFYNPVVSTVAYLRYGTAGDVATVTGAVTDLSTIKLTTTGRTFSDGSLISVFGVEGCYEANGTRLKVKLESGDTGNAFHLRTLANANVTPCATAFIRSKPGWVGLIQAFTLKDHPRVFLDGSAGALTNGLAAKAIPSYIPWAAMKNTLLAYIAGCPGAGCYYSDKAKAVNAAGIVTSSIVDTSIGTSALTMAALWKAYNQGSTDLTSTQGGLALDAGKWFINNLDLAYMQGSLSCKEPLCGDSPGRDILDVGGYYNVNLAGSYSVLRSQLTTGEKTTFNDKIWNDLDRAGATCTNSDTAGAGTAVISVGSTTVVGTGTSWLTTAAIDGTIQFGNGRFLFLIKSIEDNTHLTLYVTPSAAFSGAYRYARRWQTGDCGWSWVQKHKTDSVPPPLLHGLNYGGVTGVIEEGNNRTITMMLGRIGLALATADDDPRAVTALEEAWAWTFDGHFKQANEFFTTFTQSGVGYSWTRTAGFLTSIASMMNNSVQAPVLDMRAQWMKRMGMNMIHTLEPKTRDAMVWGYLNQDWWTAWRSRIIPIIYSMFPTAPETQYAIYALRNTLYNTSGSRLVWTSAEMENSASAGGLFNFLYGSPSDTTLDYRSTPTQYLFRGTETTPGVTSHGYNAVTSRTGWTSTTDTAVLFQAFSQTALDHMNTDSQQVGNHGSYKIYKNGPLIEEDGVPGSSPHSGDMFRSGAFEIGPTGTSTRFSGGATANTGLKGYSQAYSDYQSNQIIRWAGDDPTGDSASRYVYALGEFKGAYFPVAGVTRAQRHFAHFKGSAQDYQVFYDDVEVSSGHRIASYVHYTSTAGTVAQSDWSIISTGSVNKVATKILNPGTAGTVRVFTGDTADPAPGSIGTYSLGKGLTYRAGICASNDGGTSCSSTATAADWFVVHAPYGSTTGTMPATTILSTIDSNFRGVQIADTVMPKVFVVARNGATRTSLTFTSTHSGTGQYLASGIAGGTYDITGPMSDIGRSVVADNNTLYWEGPAGAYTIAISGSPATLTITTPSVPGGTVGVAYSMTMAANNIVAPSTWTITGGSLPAGLSISASGVISGTPTAAGTVTFTVNIEDSLPSSASRSYTSVTIDPVIPPITVTQTSIPIGTRGVAYSQQLTATGGTSPYVWTILGVNPELCGLTLTTDGLLSGILTGVCDLSIRVEDVGTGLGITSLSTSIKGLMRISGGAKVKGGIRISP